MNAKGPQETPRGLPMDAQSLLWASGVALWHPRGCAHLGAVDGTENEINERYLFGAIGALFGAIGALFGAFFAQLAHYWLLFARVGSILEFVVQLLGYFNL